MRPKSIQTAICALALAPFLAGLPTPGEAAERYIAKLVPLNAEKILTP